MRAALLLTSIIALTASVGDAAPGADRSVAVDIDLHAPVITRDEVLIDAPLHRVWDVQTDVEQWPIWQPEVSSVVRLTPGRLHVGSQWRWLTSGLDITSTVQEVRPNRRIVWGGPANGITAVHAWTFTPTSDGVLVHTEESWAGAAVEADPATAQAALDASLRNWLLNLRAEVESKQ